MVSRAIPPQAQPRAGQTLGRWWSRSRPRIATTAWMRRWCDRAASTALSWWAFPGKRSVRRPCGYMPGSSARKASTSRPWRDAWKAVAVLSSLTCSTRPRYLQPDAVRMRCAWSTARRCSEVRGHSSIGLRRLAARAGARRMTVRAVVAQVPRAQEFCKRTPLSCGPACWPLWHRRWCRVVVGLQAPSSTLALSMMALTEGLG
mmetsp:Transcript_48935/g.104730  ORF Transcript_48935/g.104730 Transcript_48935/m.104730 type:complete len:203 (-) Transcript_48935:43-651(-)